MKKLKLRVESLAVDSFCADHEAGLAPPPGTVRGHVDAGPAAPCTHWLSCVCKTAYYHCGDGYQTLYSCDYTRVAPCFGSYDDCS
jgi:hypothetical protein